MKMRIWRPDINDCNSKPPKGQSFDAFQCPCCETITNLPSTLTDSFKTNCGSFFQSGGRWGGGSSLCDWIKLERERDALLAEVRRLNEVSSDLRKALEGILAITDRDHVAWQNARAAIANPDVVK